MARGTAGQITRAIIDQVIAATQPSVTAKTVERFDAWAKEYA